ncbi:oxidoreductase [Aureococcus anophagefferens]|nr:oxidoreductase [Aureococcus anophagefferens]
MGPSPQESAREEMMAVLKANGSASDYEKALTKFVAAGGSSDDSLAKVGASVYGLSLAPPEPPAKKGKAPPAAIVPFDFMKQFMKDTLVAYGVPEAEAETSAEPIDVVRESPTSALVDGNLGLGLYVGPYCMKLAIEKAKKHGVGFVVAQNSTHYGIAGYYATMASDAGCVGLTGTNARPSIAPTFGTEPMLGTNPLCFGIPTKDGFPFCIDCATSVNQRGKIEKYSRDGKPTPKGAVIDSAGVERTDTDGILRDMQLGKCALTPVGGAGDDMGGYKGYGWATTVELLCTAFQSGPFGEAVCGIDRATGAKKPMPLGHFFLAIDIAPLCPLDTFERNSTKLLDALRGSRKSPLAGGRIWTAGELEHDARVARHAQGGLSVPYPLQKNMTDLRDKIPALKAKYAKLPFE